MLDATLCFDSLLLLSPLVNHGARPPHVGLQASRGGAEARARHSGGLGAAGAQGWVDRQGTQLRGALELLGSLELGAVGLSWSMGMGMGMGRALDGCSIEVGQCR